jgi:predicted MFS family arabinose efflux permease
VGLADLPQAISLNTISFNLGRSVGPAIGGMLISLWNVSLAFVVNALSYIALIVVLLRWKPDTVRVEPKPMLAAIAVGLRFCAGSSPIRRVLIRGVTMGFGVSCFMALMPAVVRDRLHGTEIDFGMLLGLFGIGSILGALFMPIARRRFGVEKVLAAGSLFFIVAETVMGEVSNVYFALPATFIAGLGWVAVLTTLNTAIQMRSPQNIMGRCLSIYQAATFGAMALGSWSWGMAADWTDLPTTLHASSAFILTMSIVLRLVAPMPKPSEGRVDS